MTVKLLTKHHLEFISLIGGCAGSSESTHVNVPRWKSHDTAHYELDMISSQTRCVAPLLIRIPCVDEKHCGS